MKDLYFFKMLGLEEKEFDAIAGSSGFSYRKKGHFVFKQEDKGDKMYVVLFGECKVIILNKDFLDERRVLRDSVKKLYEVVDESLEADKQMAKIDITKFDSKYEEALQRQFNVQNKLLKLRQKLQKEANVLNSHEKYLEVKTYKEGEYFGELALTLKQPRAASIAATKSSFFLTITSEDFDA